MWTFSFTQNRNKTTHDSEEAFIYSRMIQERPQKFFKWVVFHDLRLYCKLLSRIAPPHSRYGLPSCFRYTILGSQNVLEFLKLLETSRKFKKILLQLLSAESVWNVMENRFISKHRCLDHKSKVQRE